MRSLSPLNSITGLQGQEKNIIDSDLVVFSSSGYITLMCGAEGSRNIPGDKGQV